MLNIRMSQSRTPIEGSPGPGCFTPWRAHGRSFSSKSVHDVAFFFPARAAPPRSGDGVKACAAGSACCMTTLTVLLDQIQPDFLSCPRAAGQDPPRGNINYHFISHSHCAVDYIDLRGLRRRRRRRRRRCSGGVARSHVVGGQTLTRAELDAGACCKFRDRSHSSARSHSRAPTFHQPHNPDLSTPCKSPHPEALLPSSPVFLGQSTPEAPPPRQTRCPHLRLEQTRRAAGVGFVSNKQDW